MNKLYQTRIKSSHSEGKKSMVFPWTGVSERIVLTHCVGTVVRDRVTLGGGGTSHGKGRNLFLMTSTHVRLRVLGVWEI